MTVKSGTMMSRYIFNTTWVLYVSLMQFIVIVLLYYYLFSLIIEEITVLPVILSQASESKNANVQHEVKMVRPCH